MQFLLGIVLGFLIASTAWVLGSLTISGAVTAAAMGALVFGLGGLRWAIPLLTFFISSTIVSKLHKNRKHAYEEKFSKGTQRDAGQVLANGGLGIFLILIQVILPTASWIWWAYLGGLAAVNADTWATELGVLSRSKPRLITNGKYVEPGTSGGVSQTGLLAAFAGAALIALTALVFRMEFPAWVGIILVTVAGVFGSLIDSLLGATIQAIYFCPNCSRETERNPLHTCGVKTRYQRGYRWMNNDAVNWLCSFAGALLVCIGWLLSPI